MSVFACHLCVCAQLFATLTESRDAKLHDCLGHIARRYRDTVLGCHAELCAIAGAPTALVDRQAFVSQLVQRAHSACPQSSAKRAPPPMTSPMAAKLTRMEPRSERHVDLDQSFPMPLFTLAAGKDLDTNEARAAIAYVLQSVAGCKNGDTAGTHAVGTAKKVAPIDIESLELTEPLHTHFLQSWREYQSRCGNDTGASTNEANATYSNAVLLDTLQCLEGASRDRCTHTTGHCCFDQPEKNAEAVSMHPPSPSFTHRHRQSAKVLSLPGSQRRGTALCLVQPSLESRPVRSFAPRALVVRPLARGARSIRCQVPGNRAAS